jgi:hypothetical protein
MPLPECKLHGAPHRRDALGLAGREFVAHVGKLAPQSLDLLP